MSDSNTTNKSSTLVRAHARNLRIAPRKLRLVSNLVKGMRAIDAITQLDFTNKKGALMVKKLIQSAIANAENNFSLQAENLYVKHITTDMGRVMKRFFPRARGSAFQIQRKMAHLNIVLEGKTAPKKSRFKLVRKEKPVQASVEDSAPQETFESNESMNKPVLPPKSNEVMKAGKIQQKRRLFNRKSGE